MKTCEKAREKLQDAEWAAYDARAEYEDQKQAAGEATFFASFFQASIFSASFNPKTAVVTILEKSMSALEKQGSAERARAKVPRAQRAAERANEREQEAREALTQCLEVGEMEPVELTLSSTIALRSRFYEAKILPPQGFSGTLPMRETTNFVEGRTASFERLGRGFYRTVVALDDDYSVAPNESTVVDDRGRPVTQSLTERVTAATPGRLEVQVGYDHNEDPPFFYVQFGADDKPLRSGQQTLTIRDPDGGCHTIPLAYADVPSTWPEMFKALRRRNENVGLHGEVVISSGWTWTEQGDLRVASRRWSADPGPLVTSASGEVILVAEASSLEVKLRRRQV